MVGVQGLLLFFLDGNGNFFLGWSGKLIPKVGTKLCRRLEDCWVG